ncbi:MAG: hypothetical protein ACR2K5_09560 [Pseudolabrys sp.]
MQSTKSADNRQDAHRQDAHRQRANLDGRYGKIGISAVAAAVRFQGEREYNTQGYFSRFAVNENE